MTTIRLHIQPRYTSAFIALLILTVAGLVATKTLSRFETGLSNDWTRTFAPSGRNFLTGINPYTAIDPASNQGFGNPPWTLLFIAPLSWLPAPVVILLPVLALLYLSVHFRQPWLLLVVGTSFPFIGTALYGNLDWVVMLGVALGGAGGIILSTFKPQAGLFAIVGEVAKRDTWRERLKLLAPLAILMALTAPLISYWLHNLIGVGRVNDGIRNFSLFPYTIPIGLTLLYLTWRKHEPLWGCAASLCLAPYFYIDSTLPLLFLLAQRNWRLGMLANLVTWGVVALAILHVLPISL